ncbi:MAG: CBS domain-containing protein [Sphaerochaetaceae bacterium]|nr:CBS domain-containing protein [Sphaerochaetaceae bacterium]
MTIEQRMSTNLVTATMEMSIQDASDLMKSSGVHCLPVLDEKWKFYGIVTQTDILKAMPSPVSTLTVYEEKTLLSEIKIRSILTRNPVIVSKDESIEKAAKIMVDNDVSWLPVMDKDKLVGVVSRVDMLKMLLEVFGTTTRGCTITFVVENKLGILAKITSDISAQGLNVVTCNVLGGPTSGTKVISIKVEGDNENFLRSIIQPYSTRIISVEMS